MEKATSSLLTRPQNYNSRTKAATAAAKSLQPCPTLCDPIDHSPPGSPVPGILQARALEWVAIAFSGKAATVVLDDIDHYIHSPSQAYCVRL